jgi:hypothetical protein
MRSRFARIVGALLLGLMVGAGAAGVAKAAQSLAHACCPTAADAAAPGDADECAGFLPLSCCDAAALPGSELPPPAPIALLTIAIDAPAAPSLAALAPRSPHASPRASPLALSVLLQV